MCKVCIRGRRGQHKQPPRLFDVIIDETSGEILIEMKNRDTYETVALDEVIEQVRSANTKAGERVKRMIPQMHQELLKAE